MSAISSTTVHAPNPTISSPASPLAPEFDRAKLGTTVINRIEYARSQSEALAKNLKASMMWVAFVNSDAVATFPGWGTHRPMTASVKRPPGDRLDLVLNLNVSGHDLKGLSDPQRALADRAKSNPYVVEVTHPDGRKERLVDPGSGKLSTAIPLSIKNLKPGKLIIEAWPIGSYAVSGYIEGRRLELAVT